MQPKTKIVEVDCYEVRRELVNWMEGEMTAEVRTQVELHLKNCSHCTAIYDGATNVVHLLSNENVLELPQGLSQRLYKRLFESQ